MPTSSQHIPTLRRLRDRLSDLSMKNRSLRLVRLPKKRAFDLAWLDQVTEGSSLAVLERLISGRRQTTPVLHVGTRDEEAQSLHRGLTYLHREVNLVEDERGVYDLSLGLLFLCGTIGNKYIQAPVFLLPRRLSLERKKRGGTRWALQPIDDPKEVNVNRTLLLALQKYAGQTLDIEKLEEDAIDLLFGKRLGGDGLLDLAKAVAQRLAGHGLQTHPTVQVWNRATGTSPGPGSRRCPNTRPPSCPPPPRGPSSSAPTR